jgi:hypothetical protein
MNEDQDPLELSMDEVAEEIFAFTSTTNYKVTKLELTRRKKIEFKPRTKK